MKKQIIQTSIITALLLSINGCGNSDTSTNSNSSIATAYYIDSAVEGIDYVCGSQNGITDNRGAFQFEKGKDCTFSLGDIVLKNISTNNLNDGDNLLEKNATIASFLQTLDNDGNAENGIQITESSKVILKENNLEKLPQSRVERRELWTLLKNNDSEYKGRSINEEEAQAHLVRTQNSLTPKKESGMHGDKTLLAYYGDKENNRIVVVDVDKMELIDSIATGHEKSYAAEKIKVKGSHSKTPIFYVPNRGSDVIDVLDSKTNTIIKSINLDFHPRSINVNEDTGLVVVSGVDKPMVAVIDSKTNSVIATVGSNIVTYPTTSGHSYISSGTLACGHPEWLNEDHFVLLDRQNRKIDTYKISKNSSNEWITTLVNSLATPSPIHNLIPPEVHGKAGHNRGNRNNNEENNDNRRGDNNQGRHNNKGHGQEQYSTIFYATAEGATDVYPSVLKLEFTPTTGLSIVDELPIKDGDTSANIMGVHHLNFLKNQKYIYVGSDEGGLFVVNYQEEKMSIEKIIKAGKGAGHTTEMEHGGNIAIVINHKDSFITLINTNDNSKIADIKVSNIDASLIGKVQTQSHPQYHFSKDGKYFYLFLTEEGELVKVDLVNKRVEQRLSIGGKLAMGTFLGE